MRINDAGTGIVKRFEGCKLKPYKDSVGIPTIGWGHTAGVTMKTPPITQAEADELLQRDLRTAEAVVERYVKVSLSENQFSALTSFVFNIGEGKAGYKDGFAWLKNGNHSTILVMLNDKNFAGAAQEFTRWTKAGGVTLQGLVNRRLAEQELFIRPA